MPFPLDQSGRLPNASGPTRHPRHAQTVPRSFCSFPQSVLVSHCSTTILNIRRNATKTFVNAIISGNDNNGEFDGHHNEHFSAFIAIAQLVIPPLIVSEI